jgi:predicted RNase H-like HicB family nuclease
MASVAFHVEVHEDDDGSLWAEVRELPGCFASGFSLDELKGALFEAMQMSLPDGITLGEPEWESEGSTLGNGGKPSRRMLVRA